MRKILVGLGATALIAGAMIVPAGAATQTGTQTIDATISSSFTMSLSDSTVGTAGAPWALSATGANSRAAGTLSVSSNSPYTVTVQSDRATLTEHDGAGYVTGPRSLGAPTTITAGVASGSGVGVAATAVSNAVPLTIGTGALSSDVFNLTLNQVTTIADATLPAGRTYHALYTYTGTSAL